MFKPKEFKVYEDAEELYITYKWFTPSAIFLGMFSVFWMGFLAFWYITAFLGGAPLIFFLFPLIHLAVGIFISHQALSMFFNTTAINVSRGQLSITHTPIPTFKGNQLFETADIDQIYVKEKRGNKGSRSYELRAKLANEKDVTILNIAGMNAERAAELEVMLEKYIGISDEPVSGEYITSKVRPASKNTTLLPRRQRKAELPENARLVYSLRPNQQVVIKGTPMTTVHLTQNDWNNGNTNKLLQLTDATDKPHLLYLQQNKGIITAALERELNILETQDVDFSTSNPPEKVTIEGQIYLLHRSSKGNAFFSHTDGHVAAEEWIYQSLLNSTYIRVTNNDKLLTWYSGSYLPLQQIGLRTGEELKRGKSKGYSEDEFV